MLANTIQGKAISIARIARNRRIFSGIICRLMIQNPSTPIARRAATDCKVILKICILNLFPVQVRVKWRNEKLIGDLSGAYSRRITIQHRLVYQVLQERKTVKVIRMWTHYE
jgi:Txe/YoeB family toxin of toxin-antitoxin system